MGAGGRGGWLPCDSALLLLAADPAALISSSLLPMPLLCLLSASRSGGEAEHSVRIVRIALGSLLDPTVGCVDVV